MKGAARNGAADALRTAAVAAFAVAAVLAGPDAALATTDTTFGSPLDTVQDIVGGTGGQLAAALAVPQRLARFERRRLRGRYRDRLPGSRISSGTRLPAPCRECAEPGDPHGLFPGQGFTDRLEHGVDGRFRLGLAQLQPDRQSPCRPGR